MGRRGGQAPTACLSPARNACQILRIAALPQHGTGCVDRIHRAIDFVACHLGQPLPLQAVAAAAHLSPCHFHRVFRALTGETLNDFVKRLRLEKALGQMAHHPRQPLTAMALACGFASMSDFSRCFKQRHGVPTSRFDLAAHRAHHRQELGATVVPFSAWRRQGALPPGANPDGFVATTGPVSRPGGAGPLHTARRMSSSTSGCRFSVLERAIKRSSDPARAAARGL